MRKGVASALAALVALTAAVGGCTVHPAGEFRERAAAVAAGRAYVRPLESREAPDLAADATAEQLVAYALLTNAGLEQKYWEWRAALEQVPQEGTQKTGLMLTFSSVISHGSTSEAMNSLGLGNDPMNNVVLPSKLEAAATVALELAREAGRRFDQARYELRGDVLAAYADYALSAELMRLGQANVDLLTLTARVMEARAGNGRGSQQELLRSANELELARNSLAAETATLSTRLAALNALLNRDPGAPLRPPAGFPEARPLPADDAAFLKSAASENRELQALAIEVAAQRGERSRAKQEYLPDFSVNVSTDLAGAAQSLVGSVVVPAVRYQAINGQIRQAEANLRAAEAGSVQGGRDLARRLVADLALVRDLDRQIALYEGTLLPREQEIAKSVENGYAAGQGPLSDLLEVQRAVLDLRRLVAEFRASRMKHAADLEAAVAMP